MTTPTARATILALLAPNRTRSFDELSRAFPPAMLREMAPELRSMEDEGLIERGGSQNRLTDAGRVLAAAVSL